MKYMFAPYGSELIFAVIEKRKYTLRTIGQRILVTPFNVPAVALGARILYSKKRTIIAEIVAIAIAKR